MSRAKATAVCLAPLVLLVVLAATGALPTDAARGFGDEVTAEEPLIDIDLRGRIRQPYEVGDEVEVKVYFASNGDRPRDFASAQFGLLWEPLKLVLLRAEENPDIEWLDSGFIMEPSGINEADPPRDGDAIYFMFAKLGEAGLHWAPPEGVRILSLFFRVVGGNSPTIVDVPPVVYGPRYSLRTTIAPYFTGGEIEGELGEIAIPVHSCDELVSFGAANRGHFVVLAEVQLAQPQRGWTASVDMLDDHGNVLASAEQSSDDTGLVTLRFPWSDSGTYAFVTTEIRTPDGETVCAGLLESARVTVSGTAEGLAARP